MTPQTGLRFFSFVPVSLASKTLEGLFELTQCLSGASTFLEFTWIVPRIYKNRDTLGCVPGQWRSQDTG